MRKGVVGVDSTSVVAVAAGCSEVVVPDALMRAWAEVVHDDRSGGFALLDTGPLVHALVLDARARAQIRHHEIVVGSAYSCCEHDASGSAAERLAYAGGEVQTLAVAHRD